MIKCNQHIAILLATYNGEKYLREQIESLFAQTYKDWHIYVHDDGSKDGTMSILSEYASQHADKVTLLDYASQGGACRNFLSLLDRVDAPYYMFCDQDDVWHPDKVALTMQAMEGIENSHPSLSIIVHTDLMLTDESLNVTAQSFIANQRIRIDKVKRFEDYAATNTVTGCTMLFNNMAKGAMKPLSPYTMMHDSWLCLSTVAQGGIIHFIPRPTIMYRQHADNTLGAKKGSEFSFYHKLCNIKEQIAHNIQHYKEMNAIKRLTVIDFISAKIRYKK